MDIIPRKLELPAALLLCWARRSNFNQQQSAIGHGIEVCGHQIIEMIEIISPGAIGI